MSISTTLRSYLEDHGRPYELLHHARALTSMETNECETGSMPPFGEAFGLRVVVDDALLEAEDVYCESGDHTQLVHLTGPTFRTLMRHEEHGHFSSHV